MVAIDTNVLVRLLVGDHPVQSNASRRLFRSQPIFIPDTVLLETEWVLRAAYALKPSDVCAAFRKVCGLPNVRVADCQLIASVIDWHEAGLDFADAFHLALSSGQNVFMTFDARFRTLAAKHTNHRVEKPA